MTLNWIAQLDRLLSDRCTVCFILLLKRQKHIFTYFSQSWKVVKRLTNMTPYQNYIQKIHILRDIKLAIIFQSISIWHSLPFSASLQDRWKQFIVDPAERGSSIGGVSTLGGSGGMLPREILKFGFSKTHILAQSLGELTNWNEPKYTVKMHMQTNSRHQMVKEWLLQAF